MSGRKKGHPKKNVCKESIMDYIEEAKKKKHKRRVRMFCKICHKFNYDTDQCMKDSANQVNTLEKVLDEVLDETADWDNGKEGKV
jgi:hypothetical protein